MGTFLNAIEEVLRERGVLQATDHPELAPGVPWLVRTGRLVRLLPGIYCAPGWEQDWTTRIRAARLWCPDGVLTGEAAAKVSFWPAVPITEVVLADHRPRPSSTAARLKVRVTVRTVEPELITDPEGLRYTEAALTALDLCTRYGGAGIDQALRMKATTLARLHEVLELTRRRPGNGRRRQLLRESRNEPWSAFERRTHALLHGAGIGGWQGNLAVPTPSGTCFVDIGFPQLKLAIELDGWAFHSSHESFQVDRARQNWLVAQGWTVLRFTWEMVVNSPEAVLETIRATLVLLQQRNAAPTR